MSMIQLRPGDGVTLLTIARIRRDPRTQPRNHIDHETVQRYADALDNGDVLPPVTVFFDGTDYWLSDGWHRVAAHGVLDRAEVPVDIRTGSLRDAEWHSFSVNAKHGYARSREDVERILNRIFADPEWSRTPLRAIARHTAIPYVTVHRRYSKIAASDPVDQIKSVERAVTRGGTTYTMNTAGIGRRPPFDDASAIDPRQIDIEDVTGPTIQSSRPAPDPRHTFDAFPPEHAKPATEIRYLVNALHCALNLSARDAARACPWDRDAYRRQIAGVARWLLDLEEELKP